MKNIIFNEEEFNPEKIAGFKKNALGFWRVRKCFTEGKLANKFFK